MKSLLTTVALVAALAYPCLAFSEFLGARFFLWMEGGMLTGVFSSIVLGLIFVADYSGRPRPVTVRARAGGFAACELHRLAA